MSSIHYFLNYYKSQKTVRFIFVGLLNTSFSYVLYALFLSLGLAYQLANLGTLLISILFSFKTQGYLVFRNSANHLLGRFILSWALIYGCVIALIGQIMTLGFNAYAAGALALPFSMVLSYLSQNYFVFRRPALDKEKLP